MMIYFTLDNNGYLTGWSSTPSNVDNEFSLEVEEGHEVLSNPFVFKYENGQLVKDEQKQQELINEMNKPSEIEQLRQENQMLAMAVMELGKLIMGGV